MQGYRTFSSIQVYGKGKSPIKMRLDVKSKTVSNTFLHTTSKYGLQGLWRGSLINIAKV